MERLSDRYPLPMVLLALLFAAKAFFLAFWVTPLWDVPDETGHVAYISDIAKGRGIPRLGAARIGADIQRNLTKSAAAEPVPNWIAQHPPLYYAIAAIPYKIGSSVTNDVELLYRCPRVVSVVSGAMLLLVLFRMFRAVGIDAAMATSLAAAVGFVPMVSHLASGTNNDMFLFLSCALATLYLSRYLLRRRMKDAYWCALWLAVAGGVKMTAWVFLAVVIPILLVELSGSGMSRARHATALSLLALSTALGWMLRNMNYFHDPFHTAGSGAKRRLAGLAGYSLSDYLHSQPVVEHFLLNFYGLLGWKGTGCGQVAWLQVDGLPRAVFSLVLLGAAILAVVFVAVHGFRTYRDGEKMDRPAQRVTAARCRRLFAQGSRRRIALGTAVLLGLYVAVKLGRTNSVSPDAFGSVRILAVALLVLAAISAAGLLLWEPEPRVRIACYGLIAFLVFGGIVVYQVYGSYLVGGKMRATHGRYFFPVIPFLLLSVAIACRRLGVPAAATAVVAGALACMELETFVAQAFPFYFGDV